MKSHTTFAADRAGTCDTGPTTHSTIRGALTDSLYAITAFPISLLGFALALPLLMLGVALAALFIGLPVLAGVTVAARALAELERNRLRSLLGTDVGTPTYRSGDGTEGGPGWWRTTLAPLRDPQSWRDVTWSLVAVLTGTLAFALVITWWTAALAGLTYWLWQGFLPAGTDTMTLASVLGFSDNRFLQSILNLAIGVVAVASLPVVVHLAASAHAGLAAALLTADPDPLDPEQTP